MRKPYDIILRAMEAGQVIEFPDTCRFAFDDDDDICLVLRKCKLGDDPETGEDVYYKADLAFNTFRQMCDKFTPEQLALFAANTALIKAKESRGL